MLKWFKKVTAKFDANQLERDTIVIINQARQMFGHEAVKTVANLLSAELDKSLKQFGQAEIDIKRAIVECRRLHKEAIKRNDQKFLSAITLVIIFLKAQLIGEMADSTQKRILNFIDTPNSGSDEKLTPNT